MAETNERDKKIMRPSMHKPQSEGEKTPYIAKMNKILTTEK
jgi:hypothetical protein